MERGGGIARGRATYRLAGTGGTAAGPAGSGLSEPPFCATSFSGAVRSSFEYALTGAVELATAPAELCNIRWVA